MCFLLLSNLVLDSENLNRVLDEKSISLEQALEVFSQSETNPVELFSVSKKVSLERKGKTVSFSKKAFLNVINLCRDTCSYCTYKSEPGQPKVSMMPKEKIAEILKLAKKYHCVEALFVTGEKPEQRYPEAREWLKDNGFSTLTEFLIHSSEMAIKEGLFPHTNAGNMSFKEMNELKKTNPSMGLMLESSSERLTKKGMPHYLAPSKSPSRRIEVLRNAGRLKIPMTTGLLLGIGETSKELIESIFEIKKIHDEFGNIQEIILQNFQPKEDTAMRKSPAADKQYFKTMVALTRIILPDMNIQIPPNLSPSDYQDFLNVGINDWGGISPLTPDFVNPEFKWPSIQSVEEFSTRAGFNFKCRFPVYPEFIHLVNNDLKELMAKIANEGMFVDENYWREYAKN